MAVKPYIKLDYDWRNDSKVIIFEERYGKASLVDLITMFILMADCGGQINMRDEGELLKAKRALGYRKNADVLTLADRMVECRLADETLYQEMGYITSNRSRHDADSVTTRRNAAEKASIAAAKKRKKNIEMEIRDGDRDGNQ